MPTSLVATLPQEESSIFGVQSEWICFKKPIDPEAGKKLASLEYYDVSLLYLLTQRTLADLKKEANAKIKKENVERKKKGLPKLPLAKILSEDSDVNLVRIQCPALQFDAEADYATVWKAFLKTAGYAAALLTGKKYAPDDTRITTAWKGEARSLVRGIS